MQSLFLGFSDGFISEKFFNYLKNVFNNVVIFNASFSDNNRNILIADLDFLKENQQSLKNTNIILLINEQEKAHSLQNTFVNLSILDLPIKMQDLIDAINQINVSIDNTYYYDDWFLDLNNNVLSKENKVLNLSEKEALILKEFFTKPNQSITKEHFMKEVWNIQNTDVESQSLESYISTLRRKFIEGDIKLSITKNKEGYRLTNCVL